jgi:hypothetical protein
MDWGTGGLFARRPASAYDRDMRRALLLLALLATPALADGIKTKKTADAPKAAAADGPEPAPAATHNEGDYGGVVPGQPRKEASKRSVKAVKGMLSWVGFEAKDGGAEVFFQSIAPFEVTQRVDGSVLYIYLTGLNRLGPNTWRPVDARYFDTPVARLVARRVGATRGKNAHPAGIEVRVTFKNAKDAAEGALRTNTEADGFFYAYLSWKGTGGAAQPTMEQPEQ